MVYEHGCVARFLSDKRWAEAKAQNDVLLAEVKALKAVVEHTMLEQSLSKNIRGTAQSKGACMHTASLHLVSTQSRPSLGLVLGTGLHGAHLATLSRADTLACCANPDLGGLPAGKQRRSFRWRPAADTGPTRLRSRSSDDLLEVRRAGWRDMIGADKG